MSTSVHKLKAVRRKNLQGRGDLFVNYCAGQQFSSNGRQQNAVAVMPGCIEDPGNFSTRTEYRQTVSSTWTQSRPG